MTADRMLTLLSLLALAGVGITGLGRAIALAARGVWVLPIDRERSLTQGLADLAFALGLVVWVAGAFEVALAHDGRPALLTLPDLRIAWSPVRWLGLATAMAGVVLYGLALRDLGDSWRFTIDRERPGALVTTGVFSITRNPIYLALVLLALGVSLALGSLLLLLLASGAPPYLHHLVRREERFLAAHDAGAYAAYCARVPRWLRRSRHSARHGRRGATQA